jgi:uncharacterized RmlC-like cupin family protein
MVSCMISVPRVVWMPGGLRLEIHLGGDDTAGAFCLMLDDPPANWSLPEHRHRAEAETIHVLDGEFEVTMEARTSRLRPGETLHVPAGAVHATRNVGARRGRRMVIYSPAGIENFFLEAGAVTSDADVNLGALVDAATRYGWEFLASRQAPS